VVEAATEAAGDDKEKTEKVAVEAAKKVKATLQKVRGPAPPLCSCLQICVHLHSPAEQPIHNLLSTTLHRKQAWACRVG
jgi:hypothetical protein